MPGLYEQVAESNFDRAFKMSQGIAQMRQQRAAEAYRQAALQQQAQNHMDLLARQAEQDKRQALMDSALQAHRDKGDVLARERFEWDKSKPAAQPRVPMSVQENDAVNRYMNELTPPIPEVVSVPSQQMSRYTALQKTDPFAGGVGGLATLRAQQKALEGDIAKKRQAGLTEADNILKAKTDYQTFAAGHFPGLDTQWLEDRGSQIPYLPGSFSTVKKDGKNVDEPNWFDPQVVVDVPGPNKVRGSRADWNNLLERREKMRALMESKGRGAPELKALEAKRAGLPKLPFGDEWRKYMKPEAPAETGGPRSGPPVGNVGVMDTRKLSPTAIAKVNAINQSGLPAEQKAEQLYDAMEHERAGEWWRDLLPEPPVSRAPPQKAPSPGNSVNRVVAQNREAEEAIAKINASGLSPAEKQRRVGVVMQRLKSL